MLGKPCIILQIIIHCNIAHLVHTSMLLALLAGWHSREGGLLVFSAGVDKHLFASFSPRNPHFKWTPSLKLPDRPHWTSALINAQSMWWAESFAPFNVTSNADGGKFPRAHEGEVWGVVKHCQAWAVSAKRLFVLGWISALAFVLRSDALDLKL